VTVAGLVLAAGAGTRYGQPKAPVIIGGERLVDRAVRVLTEGGCDPVYVVLGAWVGEVDGADIVVNDAWPEGMGSSLRMGLTVLSEQTTADAVIVTLVGGRGGRVRAGRKGQAHGAHTRQRRRERGGGGQGGVDCFFFAWRMERG
jgi:nicotine blue oxidoreductase